MDIYQLSQLQLNNLTFAAEEAVVIAVIEPSPSDSLNDREKYSNGVREAEHLVALGLMEDVSDKFKAQVQKCRREHKRGVRLLSITPMGSKMFYDSEERPVN